MKKQVLIYLLARGIPGILNFLLIVKLTHLLQPQDYGKYVLIVALSTFINIAFFQWNKASLSRLLHIDALEYKGLISNTGSIFTTLSLVLITVSSLIYFAFNSALFGEILTASILGSLMAWQDLALELLRSRQNAALFAIVSIARPLSMLLAIYIIPDLNNPYSLIALLAISILMSLSLSLGSSIAFIKLSFTKYHLRHITSFGLPLAIGYISGYAVSILNRILLGWVDSERAAGLYSASFDIVWQTIVVLMMTVNLANYPVIMRKYELDGSGGVTVKMRQNLSILLAISLPFVILFCISSREVADILLPPDFRSQAVYLLPTVALSALLMGIRSYHFDMSFHIHKMTKTQTSLSLLIGVASIPTSYVMISYFGISGAAFSTLLMYSVHLIATIALVKKNYDMKYSLNALREIFMPCFGMILSFVLLSSILNNEYIYKAVVSLFIFYIIWIFISKRHTLPIAESVLNNAKSGGRL